MRSLTKGYPGVTALSFIALAGEVTGYLGPIGSGKSTAVKIITGLLEPTAGDVLYKGCLIRSRLMEYKTILGARILRAPNTWNHL